MLVNCIKTYWVLGWIEFKQYLNLKCVCTPHYHDALATTNALQIIITLHMMMTLVPLCTLLIVIWLVMIWFLNQKPSYIYFNQSQARYYFTLCYAEFFCKKYLCPYIVRLDVEPFKKQIFLNCVTDRKNVRENKNTHFFTHFTLYMPWLHITHLFIVWWPVCVCVCVCCYW